MRLPFYIKLWFRICKIQSNANPINLSQANPAYCKQLLLLRVSTVMSCDEVVLFAAFPNLFYNHKQPSFEFSGRNRESVFCIHLRLLASLKFKREKKSKFDWASLFYETIVSEWYDVRIILMVRPAVCLYFSIILGFCTVKYKANTRDSSP